MKIVLTHGFFLSEDKTEQKIMKPYPPLGLLCVSAYLDREGLENKIFDSTFSTLTKFYKFLEKEKPEYLGIYVNFLTRINVLQIISWLRRHEVLKKTKVILGGPDVRYHADHWLKFGADYIVLGEGEETLTELIQVLDQGLEPLSVEGLIYNRQGAAVINRERWHISDLDDLPLPAREKIDMIPYLKTWEKHHGYSSMTINTQRGCPYTCNWCSHAVFGDTYRRRSPDSVVKEIRMLVKTYHPDSFWFVDDVFTMSERWINSFAEELKKKNLQISYECISRADKLNEDIILKLKNSGCRTLWIGAESGSQKVIDKMDRRVDVMRVREMIRLARASGIKAGTFIMLGYPGETIKDIRETVRHLKKSDPDLFTINLAYPIKGTRMYDEVSDRIEPSYEWHVSPDRDMDFTRTYPRRFYDFAIRMVYNEVYAYKNLKKRNFIQFLKLRNKSAFAGMMMLFTR